MRLQGFKLADYGGVTLSFLEGCHPHALVVMELPLPKKKYGNDMTKVGPYLTHVWKWYGKVG